MKKQNKIFLCVSADEHERRQMVAQLAVRLGLAAIASDAIKTVKDSIYDIDLANAYVVLVSSCNLRESPQTTHRLYELAARGIAVILGTKRCYAEHEYIATQYYPSDFARL